MERLVGNKASYSECPRAQLFKELQPNLKSFKDLKYTLQYNQYLTDPISNKIASNGIMARGDLNPLIGRGAFGGIDTKCSTYFNLINNENGGDDHQINFNNYEIVSAIAGPTHQDIAKFCWKPEFYNMPHFGHPECFDYDWVDVIPFQF